MIKWFRRKAGIDYMEACVEHNAARISRIEVALKITKGRAARPERYDELERVRKRRKKARHD